MAPNPQGGVGRERTGNGHEKGTVECMRKRMERVERRRGIENGN